MKQISNENKNDNYSFNKNDNPFINNQSIENENNYELIDKYISRDNFSGIGSYNHNDNINNQSFSKNKFGNSNLSNNVKNSKISDNSAKSISGKMNKNYSSTLKRLIKEGYDRVNNNELYEYENNKPNLNAISKNREEQCSENEKFDINSNFEKDKIMSQNFSNSKNLDYSINSNSNQSNSRYDNIVKNFKLTEINRMDDRTKGTSKKLFQLEGESNKFILHSNNNYTDNNLEIKKNINVTKLYAGKKDRVDAHNKYRLYWQATPILFKDKPNEIVNKKEFIDEVKIPKEQRIHMIKRKEIRKPISHYKKF